jgi:hypothetical protein
MLVRQAGCPNRRPGGDCSDPRAWALTSYFIWPVLPRCVEYKILSFIVLHQALVLRGGSLVVPQHLEHRWDMYYICSIGPFGPGQGLQACQAWPTAHGLEPMNGDHWVTAKLNTKILYTEIGAGELK